jgi:hypothetical protein
MPVARHGTKVVPDSKSIVTYMNATWPDDASGGGGGASVTAKGALPKPAARLEKSKLTDHLWTLLAKETAAERDEGRRLLLEEFTAIDAVLAALGDGGAGSPPSVGGGSGNKVAEPDLSLVPKLEHTLVAGLYLARPPFEPFANGAFPRVRAYWEGFKATPLWEATAQFTDRAVVTFWGD